MIPLLPEAPGGLKGVGPSWSHTLRLRPPLGADKNAAWFFAHAAAFASARRDQDDPSPVEPVSQALVSGFVS